VVDLHLHTTISDGRLSPAELVVRAAAAGVRVMAVTDHDTTRATAEVRVRAKALGIDAIGGIEVTAVEQERDVHILGYFLREDDEVFEAFLAEQRERRLQRVVEFGRTLESLGMAIDVEPLLAGARSNPGRSVGRPQVAQAMIRAGHVGSIDEAFSTWLAYGRPAFVPRQGPSCEAVIDRIHAAGGLASLAHPGKTGIDHRIPALCAAGLDALEAHHSDHDPGRVEHYRSLARREGVLVTGGSDFHGDPSQRREPGSCILPEDDWHRLEGRARPRG
jgi:hypothetical protein